MGTPASPPDEIKPTDSLTVAPSPVTVRIALALFMFADVPIGLAALWKGSFALSTTRWEFLGLVIKSASTLVGYLILGAIAVFYVLVPLLSGGRIRVPEASLVLEVSLNRIRGVLSKSSVALPVMVFTIVAVPVFLIVYYIIPYPFLPPPAGRLVIPTDPKSNRMFVLDPPTNTVAAFDRTSASGSINRVWQLSIADAGYLEQMAVNYDASRIFVSDSKSGSVHIIDVKDGPEETGHLHPGVGAGAMAISADGRKLYVAVAGAIHVFDAKSDKPEETAPPVTGVGCPKGLFVASHVPRLFVSTQCGGGQDPLYVVNTRSDEVIKKLAGLAVGWMVVATQDGRKAFVSTGEPDAFNVVDDPLEVAGTIRKQIVPVTGGMALSPDGRTLALGTGQEIRFFDVNSESWCGSTAPRSNPAAIAFDPRGWVYARLQDGSLFFTDSAPFVCSQ